MEKSHQNILLHVCCGVCSLNVIEKIREEIGDPVLFFYNPNIHPAEEYRRRLAVVRQIAKSEKLKLVEGGYETESWFKTVEGLENEPEGGRRCSTCFKIRLEKTAKTALELGCGIFATTLTISPHKPADLINEIGRELAEKYNVKFLAKDFKKKDGFKKTMAAAKDHNFYRQNYCGCTYSLKFGEFAKFKNPKFQAPNNK